MSWLCSSNAEPLFTTPTSYATDEDGNLDDIKLGGFIFEPYNDGQFIVKATWFKAFDLPDMNMNAMGQPDGTMGQVGDMTGAAISVLVDGLTDEGYMADVKLFGSFAWTETSPDGGGVQFPNGMGGTMTAPGMLGSMAEESGTSYWFGAYLPVGEGAEYGTVGLEYNHGSEYWRPFTYAEDTMIGSKIAARGDAFEANYTYQINDALSFQARYVSIDYEYTGSNGFFGSTSGTPMKIDDVKDGAAMWQQLGGTQDPASGQDVYMNLAQMQGMNPMDPNTQAALMPAVQQMGMAASFAPQIVESAQDFRLYLRYRF